MAEVQLKFTGKDLTKAAIASVKSGLSDVAGAARQANGAVGSMGGSISNLTKSILSAQVITRGFTELTNGFRFIVATNIEFQKLSTQIRTFAGNDESAKRIFTAIEDFATKTPYQLQEVVQAFVTLRAAGVQTSTDLMSDLGNFASSFGYNITEIAQAVKGATGGEMEMMKRFGIQMRQEGENITASFNGKVETIKRSAADIVAYMQRVSKANFAGAMNREMETLGGKISNMKDAFGKLARTIGEAGVNAWLQKWIEKITEFTSNVTANKPLVEAWTRVLTAFAEVFLQVIAAIGRSLPPLFDVLVAGINIVSKKSGSIFADVSSDTEKMKSAADRLADAWIGVGDQIGVFKNTWNAAMGSLKPPPQTVATFANMFGMSKPGDKPGDGLVLGGKTSGTIIGAGAGTSGGGAKTRNEWTDELPASIRKSYLLAQTELAKLNNDIASAKLANNGIIPQEFTDRIKTATSQMRAFGAEVSTTSMKEDIRTKALNELTNNTERLTQASADLANQGFRKLLEPMERLHVLGQMAKTRAQASGKDSWVGPSSAQLQQQRTDLLALLAALEKEPDFGTDQSIARLQALETQLQRIVDLEEERRRQRQAETERANGAIDLAEQSRSMGPNGQILTDPRKALGQKIANNQAEIDSLDPSNDREAARIRDLNQGIIDYKAQMTDASGMFGTFGEQWGQVTQGMKNQWVSLTYQIKTSLVEAMDNAAAGMTAAFTKGFSTLFRGVKGFGGAWKAVSGAVKAAAVAMKDAMFGAIAAIAQKKGMMFLGDAIGATADFFKGKNPMGLVAAAKYTAAAMAMFALAGAAGAAGGGASGGGGANASRDSERMSELDKPAATIYINGGLINTDDPKQARALADAIGTLGNRRVEIRGGSRGSR